MRYLPPIETAVGPSVLPMADASAVSLQRALLSDDDASAAAILTSAMADDPPLAVWAFCRAGKRLASGFESLADLAAWLAKNAIEVLDWPTPAEGLLRSAVSLPADRVRGLVMEGAAVSELAASGPLAREPAKRQKAALRALVHAAPRWLLLGARVSVEAVAPPALPWLDALANQRGAVVEAVGEATAAWAKIVVSADLAVETRARRAAAESLADRWFAVFGPIADCLPALVFRLRRAKRLETELGAVLETEKIEAMAEFAAGAGHEINNPLTVIAGRAQLLLRDETDPERRKELALINAQAMRVFEMIADMRLFARPPKPEPAPFDLALLMAQLVGELTEEAARRGIELLLRASQEAIPVLADAVQIAVAVRALGQNALEAVGMSGRVEFAVEYDDSQVYIRVTDNGPGLEPQQRRHIFDAYYSARQAGRGLGMGLCKAWVIARGHGGRIDVESEPGRGAVFTLVVPR